MIRAILVVAASTLAFAIPALAADPIVPSGELTFELPDLDGNTVASSDIRFSGKVLYVTAWATWCPPCLSEIPTFNQLQDRYRSDGLEIVAIAFERDGPTRMDKLREFCDERKVTYLVLDGGPPDSFATALPGVERVKGLPIEFLIDRTGNVVASRNSKGFSKRWARRLEKEIVSLLEADR